MHHTTPPVALTLTSYCVQSAQYQSFTTPPASPKASDSKQSNPIFSTHTFAL